MDRDFIYLFDTLLPDSDLLIENYSELFGYLATGRVNIRIHRDVTGPT